MSRRISSGAVSRSCKGARAWPRTEAGAVRAGPGKKGQAGESTGGRWGQRTAQTGRDGCDPSADLWSCQGDLLAGLSVPGLPVVSLCGPTMQGRRSHGWSPVPISGTWASLPSPASHIPAKTQGRFGGSGLGHVPMQNALGGQARPHTDLRSRAVSLLCTTPVPPWTTALGLGAGQGRKTAAGCLMGEPGTQEVCTG